MKKKEMEGRVAKRPRLDGVQHREVPSLLDLALLALSNNLNDCTQLHRLPDTLLAKLLKLFELNEALHVKIHSLTLTACPLKNDMMKPLQFLQNLETLCISNCGDINGIVLRYIGKLPHLKTLKLNRCRKINMGFNYLTPTPLTTLEAAFCEIESPVIPSIATISSLTTLNLMGNRLNNDDDISDFESLTTLHNLTDLNLSMNPALTDRCLEHIKLLSNLKTLNLSFCEKITAEGLKVISSNIQIGCVGCDKATSDVPNKPVVLLAEDDRLQQKIISRNLKRYNFEVEIAENGEIALEMYKKDTNYDLILMDVFMPQMDGISCVKKIREEEALRGRKRVPIIMQTADTREGQLSIYREAGCDEILPKPLDKECIALATALLKR